MIGMLTGRENPQDRIFGSVAAALIAVQHGASIVRVHDVAATNDALKVWSAVDAVKIPELRPQAVGNAGLWEDD